MSETATPITLTSKAVHAVKLALEEEGLEEEEEEEEDE